MAHRVLDWIKPGLAAATAPDYPAIRVWTPFFSAGGFASAVAANVVFPQKPGTPSPWVVVLGQVRMGQAILKVALGLYTEQPQSLRLIRLADGPWLSVLRVQTPGPAVLAR